MLPLTSVSSGPCLLLVGVSTLLPRCRAPRINKESCVSFFKNELSNCKQLSWSPSLQLFDRDFPRGPSTPGSCDQESVDHIGSPPVLLGGPPPPSEFEDGFQLTGAVPKPHRVSDGVNSSVSRLSSLSAAAGLHCGLTIRHLILSPFSPPVGQAGSHPRA